MSYDLQGKRVLVTGGSSGIGAALAEGFARRGAAVGICARRADRLAEVAARCREHGGPVHHWSIDLADLDGLAPFAERVRAELGGLDVLVNNAGMPKRRRIDALTPDVVEAVMRLNYLSPVELTLAFLPELVANAGRIVVVSSVAARLSPPGEAAYSASKAALSAFFESAAIDVWDSGVRVHLVYPSVIDTELFQLPGNDPLVGDLEALPVEAVVEPVLTAIEAGRLETYVPEWFAEISAGRFRDPEAFLTGTVEWLRSQST